MRAAILAALVCLLLGGIGIEAQRTPGSTLPAPGLAATLQQAIDRAGPGATVYAADYPPHPANQWLYIPKSLTLVGGHFAETIYIEAPTYQEPIDVFLQGVTVELPPANLDWPAVVGEGNVMVSLVGCRVLSPAVGLYASTRGVMVQGPALVRESVIEAQEFALGASSAFVVDSVLRAGEYFDEDGQLIGEGYAVGLGYGTLIVGNSVLDGFVSAGEVLEIDGGGRTQ